MSKRPYTGDSGGQPPAKKQSLAPSTSFADVLKAMPTQGSAIDAYNDQLSELVNNEHQLDFQVVDVCYEEQTALIKISGCTEEGQPVMAEIADFEPYFYISAPGKFVEDDLEPFVEYVNKSVPGNPVYDIGLFFQSGACKFKGLFEGAVEQFKAADRFLDLFIFEKKLSCLGSWITVGGRQYELKNNVKDPRKTIHIQVKKDDLKVVNPETIKIAPLRMLSADIETDVLRNLSPDPAREAVFQISCMVSVYGQPEPFYRVVFALDQCAGIDGTEVRSFSSEKQLLLAWKAFFHKVNPDVIIGHNSARFDWPFLMKRAETLRIPPFDFARIRADPVIRPTSTWFNFNWDACPLAHGRVNLDTFHCLFYESDRPYGLGAVALAELGEKKEDVKYTEMVKLQNGTPEDRRRMAIYCGKDTWLALKISEKLQHLEKLAELSRRELVTLSSLFSRFKEKASGAQFVNEAKNMFKDGILTETN